MNVDEEMLSRLEALAIEAGEAIMKIYAEDFTPEYKDDYSPVTEADTAAETLIVAGLKAFAPEIPAVAEEAFSGGHSPDISGRSGSSIHSMAPGSSAKRRIHRQYCIDFDEQPICGMIHAPALNKTLQASLDKPPEQKRCRCRTDCRSHSGQRHRRRKPASRRPQENRKLLQGRRVAKHGMPAVRLSSVGS